jgi:16S rRNA processing protein RimM
MSSSRVPLGRVLLGVIGRPHGVRGLVRVQSFTSVPEDVAAYGPVADETGARTFRLEIVTEGEMPVVRIAGVGDRDAAARLTGTKLYVDRAMLPPPEDDEYYLADLIGCAAHDAAGARIGTVAVVHDHGAGAFLEIAREAGPALLVPFTRAAVPEVTIAERRLVVVPPVEEIVRPSPADDGSADHGSASQGAAA